MSLIQEALKRQQQEAGEGELKSGPPPLRRPSAEPPPKPEPPPLTDNADASAPAPAPWDKSKKKETAGSKGVKTFLLILLLVGVFWVVWRQLKPTPKPTASEQAPSSSAVGPETQTPAEPDVLPAEPDVKPDIPTPLDPDVLELTPDVLQAEVEWPDLLLNGVVGSGAQGSCLINGQIVRVGERVQDVKVVAIQRDGVELEYQGKTRFLRVGSSTL